MLAAFCSFMYFSFCKRGFAALCKYRKLSLSLNNIAIYTCIIVGTFIFGKKKKKDQLEVPVMTPKFESITGIC
jgi:hypothetical protein